MPAPPGDAAARSTCCLTLPGRLARRSILLHSSNKVGVVMTTAGASWAAVKVWRALKLQLSYCSTFWRSSRSMPAPRIRETQEASRQHDTGTNAVA